MWFYETLLIVYFFKIIIMGTENKDKDSKTEAVIDVIVAIGKTIFDILNERRKR